MRLEDSKGLHLSSCSFISGSLRNLFGLLPILDSKNLFELQINLYCFALFFISLFVCVCVCVLVSHFQRVFNCKFGKMEFWFNLSVFFICLSFCCVFAFIWCKFSLNVNYFSVRYLSYGRNQDFVQFKLFLIRVTLVLTNNNSFTWHFQH